MPRGLAQGDPGTGDSRKGETLILTEGQLAQWRQQGLTNKEIALKAGKSESTINGLFSKYKIPPRNRRVPQASVETMVRLHGMGMCRKQIAAETGYTVSTVRNCLIEAGAVQPSKYGEESPGLPDVLIIAEPITPRSYKVEYFGHKYIVSGK